MNLTNNPTLSNQLQNEFINAICNNLKIEVDIYTIKAIKELTKHIQADKYTLFLVEIFKTNSNFKKPMQIIAEVSENFKENKKAELFADIENKAKKLVIKVRNAFLSLEKIAHNQNKSLGHFLQELKELNFTSFKSAGLNLFTDKEIIALLEVESFNSWLQAFLGAINYSLDDLETKLILDMRNKRTKFYFDNKSDLVALEDKAIIKTLEMKQGA